MMSCLQSFPELRYIMHLCKLHVNSWIQKQGSDNNIYDE